MSKENIQYIAKKIVENGKGILAADESTNTIKKRFNSINVESNEETRCFYRDTLFSTPDISKYISGVILFEETFFQKNYQNDLWFNYFGADLAYDALSDKKGVDDFKYSNIFKKLSYKEKKMFKNRVAFFLVKK